MQQINTNENNENNKDNKDNNGNGNGMGDSFNEYVIDLDELNNDLEEFNSTGDIDNNIDIDPEFAAKKQMSLQRKAYKSAETYLTKLNRLAFNVFDQSAIELLRLMRESFARFTMTKQYKRYVKKFGIQKQMKNRTLQSQLQQKSVPIKFKQSVKFLD